MYFKITQIGDENYIKMGMINVDAALYLESGDEGYEKYIAEHLVTVPVIPAEGYPRQKELDGESEAQDAYREQQILISTFPDRIEIIGDVEVVVPIFPDEFVLLDNPLNKEWELYDTWIKSLPTIQQLNQFCNHSIQFEHDVTEEEILWCFEWALALTHKNYLVDDLHCEKGTAAKVVNQNIHYLARKAFYEGVSIIPVAQQTPYMKAEIAKVASAEAKALLLKEVDFASVQTVAKYSVK